MLCWLQAVKGVLMLCYNPRCLPVQWFDVIASSSFSSPSFMLVQCSAWNHWRCSLVIPLPSHRPELCLPTAIWWEMHSAWEYKCNFHINLDVSGYIEGLNYANDNLHSNYSKDVQWALKCIFLVSKSNPYCFIHYLWVRYISNLARQVSFARLCPWKTQCVTWDMLWTQHLKLRLFPFFKWNF